MAPQRAADRLVCRRIDPRARPVVYSRRHTSHTQPTGDALVQAKALICNADRSFELADVTLAEPGATNISVRAVCSGVSIGTEFAVIMGKLNWGPYPLTTGYQAVGVVEHVGGDVEGFDVGDRVYCRDNKSITLADGVSVTTAAGTHCSAAVIDPTSTHGIAHVPDGVDDEAACLYVMPAVGLNGDSAL